MLAAGGITIGPLHWPANTLSPWTIPIWRHSVEPTLNAMVLHLRKGLDSGGEWRRVSCKRLKVTLGPWVKAMGLGFQGRAGEGGAMDPEKLDELIARLVKGANRRDTLRGLIGGALASVSAISVASAKSKHRKHDKKRHGKNAAHHDGKGGNGKDRHHRDGKSDPHDQDKRGSDETKQGNSKRDENTNRSVTSADVSHDAEPETSNVAQTQDNGALDADVGTQRKAASKTKLASKGKVKGKVGTGSLTRCKKNGKGCGAAGADITAV